MKLEFKHTKFDSHTGLHRNLNQIDIILREEKINFEQNFYADLPCVLDEYTIIKIEEMLKPILKKLCIFINYNYTLKTNDQGRSQIEIENDKLREQEE